MLASPPAGLAQATSQVRVSVDGGSRQLRQNVRQALSIAQGTRGIELLDARIVRLHQQAEGEIRRALQPYGYYSPEIDGSLERGDDRWQARYRIRPGPPVRFGSVEVEISGPGRDDPALRRQVEILPIRRGAELRHSRWTRAKDALLHRATAQGYLDAVLVEHRVDVDVEAYEARAVLRMETGPRYRFGPVRFEGTHFARDFLSRFVPFREGDPFLLDQLLAVQSALAATSYFRRVEVAPRQDEAEDRRVPILVSLQHRSRTGFSGGIGYGTDTGPRGTATWERRWLGERGDRVHAELRGSFIQRTVSVGYIVPTGRHPEDQLALTVAGHDDESFEDARSRTVQAAVTSTHLRGEWHESFSLTLKSEWFDVGQVSSRASLVLPQASWIRARADDPVWPTRGSRIAVRINATHRAIGSDMTLAQAALRGSLVRSPLEGGRLLARAEVATTVVGDFDALPVSHRLFAGGDRSIRGYGFQTVAPRDPAGSLVGGRHLLTVSLEYEQRVWGPLGLAVFGDAGNAFSRFDDPLTLQEGVGTGLRWRSPVGPVSLDVAWAVSVEGTPLRLHFNVGSRQ